MLREVGKLLLTCIVGMGLLQLGSLNWLEKRGRLATYVGPSRVHKELFKSIVFQLPIGSRQAARLTEEISLISTQLFCMDFRLISYQSSCTLGNLQIILLPRH